MKRKIAILITTVFMCAFFTVGVFAAAAEYTVKIPKGMTAAYSGKDLSAVCNIIGEKEKELKKQIKENGVLFIAVNKDNTVQVRLSAYKTGLSEKIESVSGITEETLKEISGTVSDNGYQKTAIGGTVFFKSENRLTDSGGNYLSKQYITVKNGKIYQISAFVTEGADQALADELIESVKIEQKTVYNGKQKIIIGLVIAVFLALIGFMIFGIINDVKKEK